ncbi:hypothetical protein ACJRO7_004171 [Eucalyptus globulus]|uniref:RING-type domain-containing protein n=1 Tax=Eucalyptus globulus TaxID=34317 RepID=A0ABD3IWG7_EUCGL
MESNGWMGPHYVNPGYPYPNNESFMNFFEGLTHAPVSYAPPAAPLLDQESMYWSMSMNAYKFGSASEGSNSYYSSYEMNHQMPRIEVTGSDWEQSSRYSVEEPARIDTQYEEHASTSVDGNPEERSPNHQSPDESQAGWQDDIDPDNMTYEELLDLGEAIGTQNKGLSQELISMLPTSKYKLGGFFTRKKSGERCVICQMRYKIGDRRIKLPCKHAYHGECITKWLGINKICPVCNVEVFGKE